MVSSTTPRFEPRWPPVFVTASTMKPGSRPRARRAGPRRAAAGPPASRWKGAASLDQTTGDVEPERGAPICGSPVAHPGPARRRRVPRSEAATLAPDSKAQLAQGARFGPLPKVWTRLSVGRHDRRGDLHVGAATLRLGLRESSRGVAVEAHPIDLLQLLDRRTLAWSAGSPPSHPPALGPAQRSEGRSSSSSSPRVTSSNSARPFNTFTIDRSIRTPSWTRSTTTDSPGPAILAPSGLKYLRRTKLQIQGAEPLRSGSRPVGYLVCNLVGLSNERSPRTPRPAERGPDLWPAAPSGVRAADR